MIAPVGAGARPNHTSEVPPPDSGGWADAFFLEQAQKDGFEPFEDGDALPPAGSYMSFTRVTNGIIRFTYRDDDGNEAKRIIFKSTSPDAFARVDSVRDFFEKSRAETGGVVTSPDQMPSMENLLRNGTSITVPAFAKPGEKIYAVEFSDNDDGQKRKMILVDASLSPEAYDIAQKALDKKIFHGKNSGSEGYRLFTDSDKDQLPEFHQFTNFSDPGEAKRGGADGIAFEYTDNAGVARKGIVYKDAGDEAFAHIEKQRQLFTRARDFLAEHDGLRLAEHGWSPPPSAHFDVQRVGNKLGQGAYIVTVYENEKRDKIDHKMLVLEHTVGKDTFNRLVDAENHDAYLDFFESQEGKLWTDDTFPSGNGRLTAGNVSFVITDFMDRGFIMVSFADEDGFTLFSERETPEAYDLVRNFVNTGDDKHTNTSSKSKPKVRDVASLPGEWGKRFENLRDKGEFPEGIGYTKRV